MASEEVVVLRHLDPEAIERKIPRSNVLHTGMPQAGVGRIAIEHPERLGGDLDEMAHLFSPNAARSG